MTDRDDEPVWCWDDVRVATEEARQRPVGSAPVNAAVVERPEEGRPAPLEFEQPFEQPRCECGSLVAVAGHRCRDCILGL